jgi:hypothetical protein
MFLFLFRTEAERGATMARKHAGTPEVKNPKRVAAGKRNRAKWKGFTEEGLQRLRETIFRIKPWRFTRGPTTPEGKAQVARNGKKRQLGPTSIAEAKVEVAGLQRALQALREYRAAVLRS